MLYSVVIPGGGVNRSLPTFMPEWNIVFHHSKQKERKLQFHVALDSRVVFFHRVLLAYYFVDYAMQTPHMQLLIVASQKIEMF